MSIHKLRHRKINTFKIWLRQVRAPFLILSIVLVLIGIAAAFRDGDFHWLYSAFLLIGVTLAHISVNLFNELSDCKTQIDAYTTRTPFSGGSGLLQAGQTSPRMVRLAAYISLLIAGMIGFYFFFCAHAGWPVLVFMIAGGLSARFYTSHFARWMIGEFAAGLTLGSFVVMGSYCVLTGALPIEIVYLSVPPGLLTFLLLFLNEFPDAEADRKGGRKHLVIRFGKRNAARMYVGLLISVYLLILIGPFLFDIPYTILISLLMLPLAFKAGIAVLKNYDNLEKLLSALGINVGIVILTDLLMAVGYFL